MHKYLTNITAVRSNELPCYPIFSTKTCEFKWGELASTIC